MNTLKPARPTSPKPSQGTNIVEELRALGYELPPVPPKDPDLIEIAGRQTWPTADGVCARVRATCKARQLKIPVGFSPSNIAKASTTRLREFAKKAKVPLRWLISGTEGIDQMDGVEHLGPIAYPDELDDGQLGYPDFLEPYVHLRDHCDGLRHLARCWSSYAMDTRGLSSDHPDHLVHMVLGLVRKMKDTKQKYTNRIAQELAYRDEVKLVKTALIAYQDATRRGGASREAMAKLREDLIAAINASSFDPSYVERVIAELGLDPKALTARIGINFTRWPWKSDDPFYKLRPDGEEYGLIEGVPFLPWVHLMLPHRLEYERAEEDRSFTLTVNREELTWILLGFCGQYMSTDMAKKDIEEDPLLWERKCSFHKKLFTVHDCQPIPTIGTKTARPKKKRNPRERPRQLGVHLPREDRRAQLGHQAAAHGLALRRSED